MSLIFLIPWNLLSDDKAKIIFQRGDMMLWWIITCLYDVSQRLYPNQKVVNAFVRLKVTHCDAYMHEPSSHNATVCDRKVKRKAEFGTSAFLKRWPWWPVQTLKSEKLAFLIRSTPCQDDRCNSILFLCFVFCIRRRPLSPEPVWTWRSLHRQRILIRMSLPRALVWHQLWK